MTTPNVFRYLTDDGLVADGTNQVVVSDGSSVNVPYYAGPDSGEYWHIERMIIYIEDGAASPKITEYGAATALSNGLRLYVTRGGPAGVETLDLMGGGTVKSNGDWASFCYDVQLSQPGSGNGVVSARWTFGHSGESIILSGARNDKLVLLNRDQLNVLVDHRFHIHGVESHDPHPILG